MKTKKVLFPVLIVLIMISLHNGYAKAADNTAADDPARLNNIIVTLLMPPISDAVNNFYKPYLTIEPTVVPYYGSKIIMIHGGERVREGIYSSSFTVTVEVFPYVGPHLSVGKDRITLSVRPNGITTLESYQHLESHQLTPNYQSLIKNPLP
ncbi:MAG: DUF3888 domain-containing protein [Oscillospiraceae bacterium]